MAQHQSDRYINLVRAVIRHAIAHRRMCGWFADFVGRVIICTDFRGKKWESFSHCYAAFDRNGAQHRNTSRDMLGELAEMHLVTRHGYRSKGQNGGGNEFHINSSRIYKYANEHNITPMMPDTDECSPSRRPRTKADWDRDMAAWREARRKELDTKEQAARAERAANREREDAKARQGAMTPEERRQANADWLKRDPRAAKALGGKIATRQIG